MPGVGELGVQGPEHAREAAGMLRHRLREIPSGRADSADYADGPLFPAERGHRSPALVELGQAQRQAPGEAFLGRHFLQAHGHLPQGLGPPAGGVGEDGHVVAHVPVIFGHRDPGVDGNFARRHRHIRGVRDEDGALHQRAAGARVLELGKFAQNLGHLVAALAAAYEDYYPGVRPLGQLVLGHRLAGAEPARDAGAAAFRYRKKSVYDTLPGHQRPVDQPALRHRPRPADRPFLQHFYFHRARRRVQHGQRLRYRIFSGGDG